MIDAIGALALLPIETEAAYIKLLLLLGSSVTLMAGKSGYEKYVESHRRPKHEDFVDSNSKTPTESK